MRPSPRDRIEDAINDLQTAIDSLERLQIDMRLEGVHLGEPARHVAVARTEAQTARLWAEAAYKLLPA